MHATGRGRTACAVVAAAVLLAGCAATVGGRGSVRVTGTPSATSSTRSAPQPANRFARTPVSTAIGDPVTLDFCAAIGTRALSGRGYTGTFSDTQYVPGCTVRVVPTGSSTHITVSTFLAAGERPTVGPGRRTGQVAGLRVYSYPFASATGNCERDVVVRGVTVKVSAYEPRSAHSPSAALTCGVTSALVARLAPAMAARTVPALAVATPSLTSLSGCAIARAAGLGSLSLLVGASYTDDDLAVGCGVTGKASLYVDPVTLPSDTDPDGVPVQAKGHALFAGRTNGPTFCTYTSVQGRTSSGRYEALTATTTPAGTDPLPDDACDQTRDALVRYLDTAGLK